MAHILVIDDDPTVRSLLAALIEAHGHTAVTATDGRSGMKMFQMGSIDLVVTDIVMPDQEGIATIGAIRRLSRSIPILAISGSGTVGGPGDYLHAAQALGATSTLKKPLDSTEFVEVIERLLAGSI